MGYEAVLAFPNTVKALGRKDIKLHDEIEFSVGQNDSQENGLLKGYDITAGGNKPIIGAFGELSNYYRTKINCETDQSKLENHENTLNGNKIKGFIASYNRQKNGGTIELENLEKDKRYRKVAYKINDANIKNDIDLQNYVPVIGSKIECEIIDDIEELKDIEGNIIENPIITKRAININSISVDRNNKNKETIETYLNMFEVKENKDKTKDNKDNRNNNKQNDRENKNEKEDDDELLL